MDVLAEVAVKSHPELSLEEGEQVWEGALHAHLGASLQKRLGGLPCLVDSVQSLRCIRVDGRHSSAQMKKEVTV